MSAFRGILHVAGALLFGACLAIAAVPEGARAIIDGIVKSKGSYLADEGVYKFVIPREAATIVRDDQTLSPNLELNSWIAFSSAVHKDAILTAQFLLLADEVDSVMSTILDAGLEITGLAESSVFLGPRLYTLDVTGLGTFGDLATGVRKSLDQIQTVRKAAAVGPRKPAGPSLPENSAIDPVPIDSILSMRGSVEGGVYRAAIGRRALLRGEPIGREMGMSTWVSVAGSNSHALVQAEVLANADELQKVLKALRSKGACVTSIRNHTLGEHPQVVFVRYWGEGPAVDLAKSLRFVLEVQLGRIELNPPH